MMSLSKGFNIFSLLFVLKLADSFSNQLFFRASGNRLCRPRASHIYNTQQSSSGDELENTKIAMENARKNLQKQTSPGADLPTADEQADAAYAGKIDL